MQRAGLAQTLDLCLTPDHWAKSLGMYEIDKSDEAALPIIFGVKVVQYLQVLAQGHQLLFQVFVDFGHVLHKVLSFGGAVGTLLAQILIGSMWDFRAPQMGVMGV